jgi:hypothetical protein
MAAAVSEIVRPPEIELRQMSAGRHETTERWSIRWKIENTGANPLELTSVRLPHGQFRSEEQQFEPAVALAPRGAAKFHTMVYCREPPGLVTENAFLIFNANWLNDKWRIFVRVRVVVSPKGEPQAATELITTQQVGFSGMAS